MTIWQPDPAKLKRPVYKTLQGVIIDAIDSGELRPGDRMPTHRDFAFQLNVSVQTVSRTYDALCKLGYLVGEVGRGTFVRMHHTPEAAMPFLPNRQEELIDLSMLKPVTTSLHYEVMQKGLETLSRDLTRDLVKSFRPEEAFREHTRVACKWFGRQRMEVDAKHLIFTNGAIPALVTALMSAAPPGSAICVEEVSFHSLKPMSEYLGLRIHTAAMDEQGILPEAFADLCVNNHIRVLVLSPSVANPKSYVMGMERRRALLDIARRNDVMIIENDVLGTMIKGAPTTFQQLDPERVFYITSFSKTIMPGFRVGLLVVPPRLSVAAKNRHLVTNWMANPMTVDLLTQWMDDGTVDRLIVWQAEALQQRQRMAARLLSGSDYFCHRCGPHIWLPLPPVWEESDFVNHARRNQVAIAGSRPFIMADQTTEGSAANLNAVRIALGPCSEERLETALRVIGTLLESRSETPLPMF